MFKILGNDYNEDIGHILKSIKKSDKLIINSYPFKSDIDDVNTCGRWVFFEGCFIVSEKLQ